MVGEMPRDHCVGASVPIDARQRHELDLLLKVVCQAPAPARGSAHLLLIQQMSPVEWCWNGHELPAGMLVIEKTTSFVSPSFDDAVEGDIVEPGVVRQKSDAVGKAPEGIESHTLCSWLGVDHDTNPGGNQVGGEKCPFLRSESLGTRS